MTQLNYELLQQVEDGFKKEAFVPMPGGQAEPVAGAGMMTAAQAAPMGMDPAAAGGAPPMDPMMGGAPPMDPAMGGAPPMDPAMGGAPPMDPAMAGGDPMAALAGLDPAALGGAAPEGNITMSISEFISLIGAIKGEGGGEVKAPDAPGAPGEAGGEKKPKSGGKADVIAKLDEILAAVGGAAGGGAAMPPAMPPMM